MPDFYLQPPEGTSTISEIYAEEICPNAKFKLDRPFPYYRDALFRLRDGQWFHVHHNEEHVLEGRWAVIRS